MSDDLEGYPRRFLFGVKYEISFCVMNTFTTVASPKKLVGGYR